MSDTEETEIEDSNASGVVYEGDSPATLTDRVLLQVKQMRRDDDARNGFMRDYRDGTLGRMFKGPTMLGDVEALELAVRALKEAMDAASPSWRHHLELAVALANAEKDDAALQRRLLHVAAIAVAWVEGIEMRADRRRIDREAAKRGQLKQAKRAPDGSIVATDLELEPEVLLIAAPPPEVWWLRLLKWLRLR